MHLGTKPKHHTTTNSRPATYFLPFLTQAWQNCAADPILRLLALVVTSVTIMFAFILLPKIFEPFGTCGNERDTIKYSAARFPNYVQQQV